MADGSLQAQHQPLGISYQYTPTHYVPTYVHVPENAGELYLRGGQAALTAAGNVYDALSKSPANPTVKAQWEQEKNRALTGSAYLKALADNQHNLLAQGSIGPGGFQTVSPLSVPVQQGANWQDPTAPPPKQPATGSQPPTTITRTGKNSGQDQSGNLYHEVTPGSNQWVPGPVPPEPPTNPNAGMAMGGLVRQPPAAPGYQQGGAVPPSAIGAPGTPLASGNIYNPTAGYPPQPPTVYPTILNNPSAVVDPRTGQAYGRNWEYAPTGGAQQATPGYRGEDRPEWMSQPLGQPINAAPFPRPAAPTQAQAAQPPIPMAPQPSHPVLSAKTAKDLLQNLDTSVTRVVYHPTSPSGEPAFTAYGAKNQPLGGPIPLSALVKNAGGAGAVAGENLDTVMRTADANQGQPQGPQWNPQAAAAQQGQQFAATGGPPPAAPGQGPLLTSTAYNPAPYSPGALGTTAAAAAANPQAFSAQQPSTAQQTEPPQSPESKIPLKPIDVSPDQVTKYNNDPIQGGVYEWKPDETIPGKYYTELPDPTHPFFKQRFYKGSTGFTPGSFNADNAQKEYLWEELGGPKGIPIPEGIKIDFNTIANSKPEWRDNWLRYIRNYYNHVEAPDPGSAEGAGYTNAARAIQDLQRLENKVIWLRDNHVPMSAISAPEMVRSKEAQWAGATSTSPSTSSDPGQGYWDQLAQHGPVNDFADATGQDFVHLNNHLAGIPNGTYATEAKPGVPPQQYVHFPLSFGRGGAGVASEVTLPIPQTTDVSPVPIINKIAQTGTNYDEALRILGEVKQNTIADYKRYDKEMNQRHYRTPDSDQKNISDLGTKGYIEDSQDRMLDKDHKIVNGIGPPPYRENIGFWSWLGGNNGWVQGGKQLPSQAQGPGAIMKSVSHQLGWDKGPSQNAPPPDTVSKAAADAAPHIKTLDDLPGPGKLYYDTNGVLKRQPGKEESAAAPDFTT